ncbi:MAG TPA: PilT/PilU family type 4a pilus ATPase [Solirubrobacteraceae bacterium]
MRLKGAADLADAKHMFDVQAMLRELIQKRGSDLHLKVGAPPLFRVDGVLTPSELQALNAEDTEQALRDLLTDQAKLHEFAEEHEVDFSFEIPDVARFRINAFRQRSVISLACRAIPHKINTIEELSLPSVISELSEEERGIILLTGTTGSGKSTTLAAMIDHINSTTSKHIVTIEDPIEFVHEDKYSVINQREVGMDTASFKRALRRVLRQDPDVILIGEMRDEETVQTALSAAETGHLVLSTIHTVDAGESINRMLDFFPPHQHSQARSMIAGTIKGVISQRLVPGADGGRVAACEILRMTGRVRDMIVDPAQTGKLHEVISTGAYYGMQTFDQALFGHLKAGRITMEDALAVASSPHDFKLLVQADGRKGTTMEDVAVAQQRREEAEAAASTQGSGYGEGGYSSGGYGDGSGGYGDGTGGAGTGGGAGGYGAGGQGTPYPGEQPAYTPQ